jgi:hypothetical protein
MSSSLDKVRLRNNSSDTKEQQVRKGNTNEQQFDKVRQMNNSSDTEEKQF